LPIDNNVKNKTSTNKKQLESVENNSANQNNQSNKEIKKGDLKLSFNSPFEMLNNAYDESKNPIIENKTDKQVSLVDKTSYPKTNINILPLSNTMNYINIKEDSIEISKQFIAELKPSIEKHKKFAFAFGTEYNRLEYCFDDVARDLNFELSSQYYLSKKLALGVGLGWHRNSYNFDIDASTHLAAFGETDKYPEFYEINDQIMSILNNLTYFKMSFFVNYYFPISNQWKTSLGFSQDFILNQSQSLNYIFASNEADKVLDFSSNGFDTGISNFQIGIHYSFNQKVSLGYLISRNITRKTIGVERQYYHGFGSELRLGWTF